MLFRSLQHHQFAAQAGGVECRTVLQGQTVTMPALTLQDGTTLDAARLRGKLVVLEFWAS